MYSLSILSKIGPILGFIVNQREYELYVVVVLILLILVTLG